MQPTLQLEYAQLTDVGRARPHNEDYVDHVVPTDPGQLVAKGSLFLVADGMGGHLAGEVASRGAVELVIAEYYADDSHDVPASLARAFRVANDELYHQAQADPAKGGMGTTLVAAAIVAHRVYIANVGDSRAYLIDRRGINQITEDHSWVEEQVRAGLLTPEQARRHPQRNLVTRALGSKPAVEVDIFEGEVQAGELLLLCSDGLTGRVSDAEIASIAREHSPREAAQRLIGLANDRGGNDNITALLIRAQEETPTSVAPTPAVAGRSRRGGLLVPVLVGLLAILLLALSGVAVYQFALRPTDTPTPTTAAPPASTGEPAATAAATEVTATLIPTATLLTDTPTATATATLSPTATASSTPTATPTWTATPSTVVLPPTLVEPDVGETLTGTVAFVWDYSGTELPPEYAFQLQIRRQAESDTQAWRFTGEATRETRQTLNLDAELPETGRYFWTVVVVRLPGEEVVSVNESERYFDYVQP
jgi:serine/threonine protein phosphatase PrpC